MTKKTQRSQLPLLPDGEVQLIRNKNSRRKLFFIDFFVDDLQLATDTGFGPSIRLRQTDVNLTGGNCTADYNGDFNRMSMICGGDGIIL